jgi:membrane-associated phospholipid phosphatase
MTPCVVVNKVRRIRPVYWLPPLGIAIALFSYLVPVTFWLRFLSMLRARTLLVSMVLVFGLVAVSLVWATGQKIDAYLFHFFNKRGSRPRWLDRTMQIITEFGNGVVTVGIVLALFFFVNRHLSYEFIFGTLVLWMIVELVKVLIRRSRPFTKLTGVRVVGTRARGNSFPSGHTSQAFYMATIFVQYFQVHTATMIFFYLAALMVGVTRMYLGMHYPRDVLAGAILGTCWGLIGVTLNYPFF